MAESRKTGKREVACVFMALVLVHAGYVTSLPPDQVSVYLEITRIFVWPAVLFLGAAFGMEWAQSTGLISPK